MTNQEMLKAIEDIIERKINSKIDEINQRMISMENRQDEMYSILKGWEEDKMLKKSKIDKLEIEVDKLSNHKHNLVLETGKTITKE